MPLPTIPSGNVASATAGAFEVANSCRFNDGDSAYMHQTPSGNGSNTVFTLSLWFKRGQLGTGQSLFAAGPSSGGVTTLDILSGDTLAFYDGGSTTVFITNRVFRDIASWYHIALICNTGESGTDKCKLYINGTLETSFSTDNRSSMDAVNHVNQTQPQMIGQSGTGSAYIDGYLAEIVMLDGTATAIGNLGEFDEDSTTIWKPIDVSGLSFGTNGYYLDFEDSSNLGNNAGSGAADFTEVNLAAADQAQDSPTNNFCVMNILDNYYYDSDFSQGNTVIYTNGGSVYTFNTATFLLSAGRWYWEVKVAAGTNGTGTSYVCGISDDVTGATSEELGNEGTQWGYYGAGHIRHNNGNDGSYTTYTAGDIVGVYLDLEDNKLYFTKNGTLENSGTGVSITAVTNSAIRHGGYFPASGYFDGDASGNAAYFYHNFGNGDFNGTAVSSSVADDNGYGLFEYSPNITGDGSAKKFYAICTKNLAEYGG